jgi:hypothetical protein
MKMNEMTYCTPIPKFYLAWETLVWVRSMAGPFAAMGYRMWKCIESGWKNGERSSKREKL